MIRVAIIGTSHVAALKAAWDEVSGSHQNVQVKFFAAPLRVFRMMKLNSDLTFGLYDHDQGDHDIVKQINGATSISLDDIDVVLIVGRPSGSEKFSRLVLSCDIHGIRRTGRRTLLSQQAFAQICAEISKNTVPGSEWQSLNKRVVVLHRAFPSEDCIYSNNSRYSSWVRLADNPEGVQDAKVILVEELGRTCSTAGLTLLRPPSESEGRFGLTKRAFSAGSIRLKDGSFHDEEDYEHMNLLFGRLVIRDFVDLLCRLEPVVIPLRA